MVHFIARDGRPCRRKRGVRYRRVGKDASARDTRRPPNQIVESQTFEQRHTFRGDEFPAHLVAGVACALKEHDVCTRTCCGEGSGCPGRPAADDGQVEGQGASALHTIAPIRYR